MSFLSRRGLSVVAMVALFAAPALGQTPPPPAPADGKAPEKPAVQLDATGKGLAERTDALSKQAQALVDEYRKAIEAKIQRLATENPPLGRLTKAGVFTVTNLTTGVSSDPLQGLPDIRKAYEELDQTAVRYMTEFGGLAKQSAEDQAAEFMKKIIKAQTTFREDDKDGNGILDYAPGFAELAASGLLEIPPVKRGDPFITVGGYKFRIVSADLLTWAADAAPARQEDGNVYLYTDQTGIIKAERGKAAGPLSPPYRMGGK